MQNISSLKTSRWIFLITIFLSSVCLLFLLGSCCFPMNGALVDLIPKQKNKKSVYLYCGTIQQIFPRSIIEIYKYPNNFSQEESYRLSSPWQLVLTSRHFAPLNTSSIKGCDICCHVQFQICSKVCHTASKMSACIPSLLQLYPKVISPTDSSHENQTMNMKVVCHCLLLGCSFEFPVTAGFFNLRNFKLCECQLLEFPRILKVEVHTI